MNINAINMFICFITNPQTYLFTYAAILVDIRFRLPKTESTDSLRMSPNALLSLKENNVSVVFLCKEQLTNYFAILQT